MATGRIRETGHRVLLVLAGTVLTGLVLEGAVRLTGLGFPNHQMIYNDTLVKGKPGAVYVNHKENSNRVYLNNWGFHDHDRTPQSDTRRVLVLGDSFVEGAQVPVDSLFTSHLEKAWRQDGCAVEVINAGVTGAGTAFQYQLWKDFFEDTIDVHHIVLVLFMGNDLENNHTELGYGGLNYGVYLTASGDVYVNRVAYSWPQRTLRTMVNYSALMNLVYTRLYYLKRQTYEARRRRQATPQPEPEAPQQEPAENRSVAEQAAWDETIQGTLRLIARWADETQRRGIRLSIALIPQGRSTASSPLKEIFVAQLKALAVEKTLGFQAVTFDGYRRVDTYSFDGVTMGHFNFLGHRLVAGQMDRWLKEPVCEAI